MEKDYDFILDAENALSEEEMAEAFKDFNYFESFKESLEEIIAYQEGRPNGCRVHVVETPDSPIQSYQGKDITKAREGLNLSPSGFARVLGVSVDIVTRWERGDSKPDGSACNLLYLLNCEPSLVERFMGV